MPSPDEKKPKSWWASKEWVATSPDFGPVFWADTKRECLEYCSSFLLDLTPESERVRQGVYFYTYQKVGSSSPTSFYIAEPEALEEEGRGFMLDPDNYE